MTATQKELFNYITNKNEAMKKAGSAWTLCDDVKSWGKDYQVYSPQDLEKYLSAGDVYELTRSLYHYKPSWDGLMSMTVEELDQEAERLQAIMTAQIEQERIDAEKENPATYASSGESLFYSPFSNLSLA